MVKHNKNKKIDLLTLQNSERIQMIKEVKEKLRTTILEAKLWRSLLEADDVTINGNPIYRENEQLSGFSIPK